MRAEPGNVLAGPGGVQVVAKGGTKREGVFNVVIARGEQSTAENRSAYPAARAITSSRNASTSSST